MAADGTSRRHKCAHRHSRHRSRAGDQRSSTGASRKIRAAPDDHTMQAPPALRRLCLLAGALAVAAGPLSALDPRLAITQLARDVWQDELPQSAVLSILQTRDGYLWLGTYEGLVRFDGVRFVVFDRQRTHDLQGTSVFHLSEDRAGRLWISTNGGLAVREGGRFRVFGVADGLPTLLVRGTLEARDGTLWIATDRGLAELRDGKIRPRPDLATIDVRSLAEGKDGTLWAATVDGMLRVRGGRATHIGVEQGLPAPFCRHVLIDHAGTVWGAPDRGLLQLDAAGAPRTVYRAADGLGDDYVRVLAEDGDGSLWVGTDSAGLVRFRHHKSGGPGAGAAGTFEQLSAAHGLANDFVRSIFEDRQSSMLVGTQRRPTPPP